MPPCIDIMCYPDVLDAILLELQTQGYHRTLAECRQLSSAVKAYIDSRLPKRVILSPSGSWGLSRRMDSRFWDFPTDGWHRSPIPQIYDVEDFGLVSDYKGAGSWMKVFRDRVGPSAPIVRFSGTWTARGQFEEVLPVETMIVFPRQNKQEHLHVPKVFQRVVLNMRYRAGTAPQRLLLMFGYAHSHPRTWHPSLGPGGTANVQQELVIMCAPHELAAHDAAVIHSLAPLHDILQVLWVNEGLRLTLVGLDEWEWEWIAETDEARLACLAAPETERVGIAFQHAVDAALERYETDAPVPRAFLGRLERVSNAEYESRVGPGLFRLMTTE